MADKRTALLLALLVLIALGVRVAWSAWTQPVTPLLSDPEYYHATALSIAHGDGYSVAFSDEGFHSGGEPTALWPPGYSAFLAPAFALAGDRLWAAWAMNALVGALTVVPVYAIGRRLFSPTTGFVGAAMAAVLPSFVFWAPVLLSETLFTFLFACAIAAIIHAFDRGEARPYRVIAVGFLIGLGALVRGQALVLLPIAAIWWLLESRQPMRAIQGVAASTIVALVMLTPWAMRNALVMDSPILLSANFGYNLRVGHAPYSTGHYAFPGDLWDTQQGISFRERETVFNNLGARRALRYALNHPQREVALAGHKIVWLWRPDSDVLYWTTTSNTTPFPERAWEPLRLLLDATYLVVIALAGVALLRVPQLGRAIMFPLLLIGGWTALHVVFFGEPRYHLPMLVFLIPMAASTVVWVLTYHRPSSA